MGGERTVTTMCVTESPGRLVYERRDREVCTEVHTLVPTLSTSLRVSSPCVLYLHVLSIVGCLVVNQLLLPPTAC